MKPRHKSGSGAEARARYERLRERAIADGRVDRDEAIELAIGVRKLRLARVEARLSSGQGNPVWRVVLYEKLGCHYSYSIDARTGKLGGTGGGGCS